MQNRIFGPVVQLVSTPACHAGGRGFEPLPGRQCFASVAQSVEQGTENPRVGGSIPPRSTIFIGKYVCWCSSIRQSNWFVINRLMVRFRSPAPFFYIYGRIPERPKGTDCKSVVHDFDGSNPSPPTRKRCAKTAHLFLFSLLLRYSMYSWLIMRSFAVIYGLW